MFKIIIIKIIILSKLHRIKIELSNIVNKVIFLSFISF